MIADEPTTALDVTIQAQILDLLQELQASQKMAMLLITHDLAIVARMAHRVALMYAGQVVEVADAKEFFASPLHPYAVNLFDALPDTGKRGRRLASIRGVGAASEPGILRLPVRRALRQCDGPVPDHSAGAARIPAAPLGALPAVRRAPTPSEPVTRILSQDPTLPADPPAGDVVLDVRDYRVWFPIRKGLLKRTVGYVKAVDGVSFASGRGERWRWSANPAAARRPSARRCCSCSVTSPGSAVPRGSRGSRWKR